MGSLYLSDYENSFGIDREILSNIMDGFLEEVDDEESSTEDTAGDLYDYIHYTVEWDDEYLKRMVEDSKKEIEDKYSLEKAKEYLFGEEGIYDIVGDYQPRIVRDLLGESANKINEDNVQENQDVQKILDKIYDKVNDIFYEMQTEYGIKSGDISPMDQLELDEIEEKLAKKISFVLQMQKL